MRLLLLALIALTLWFAPADAAETASQELTFRIATGKDPQLGITEICCDTHVDWNALPIIDNFRMWYGDLPVWLKIEGTSKGGLLQFSPVLDSVTLFTRTAPGTEWQTVTTGDMVDNTRKPLETPFMALPLPNEFDPESVYARIDMPVAITIRVQQWDLPAFISMQARDRTLKTFLIGFITAIVLYNLVVSGLVRDPLFLVNALAILSLLVFALYLSGYGVVYFWREWPHLSNTILVGSLLASISCGGAFMILFLQGSPQTVRQLLAILTPLGISVLIYLASLALGVPPWGISGLAIGYGGLFCIVFIAVIGRRAMQGDTRARLLALPFMAAVAPGVALIFLDKVAGFSQLGLGNNTMEITLSVEAILFSLALASRIRVTENANRIAALELLSERERSSSMALAAQDRERKRLSKELHDGVGHELLLVSSNLKQTARQSSNPDIGQLLERLIQDTSGVMKSLRRISHDMHPASIEYLGLEGAIDDINQRLNQSGSIQFSATIETGGLVIGPNSQLQIVRIVQECLSNVVKHSSASRCVTSLRRNENKLELRIEDDGVGSPDLATSDSRDFGLGGHSIDERVRNLKGKWEKVRNQSGGMTVLVVAQIDALGL